jgi:hypothetical protein
MTGRADLRVEPWSLRRAAEPAGGYVPAGDLTAAGPGEAFPPGPAGRPRQPAT